MPGVRSIPRTVETGADRIFQLTYVREGNPRSTPLLIVPGGPGLASVLPYRGIRRLAVRNDFDVVMVEHRGVGLSRVDTDGRDLPISALTIDEVVADLIAVLDDCGWDRAVIYGSSYGGNLAQELAARHPDRVSGMILDSTGATPGDGAITRDYLRQLFWHGDHARTAELAEKVRALVASEIVPDTDTGVVIPIAYEFGGAPLLDRMLETTSRGAVRPWNWVANLGRAELARTVPYHFEFDLAGAIYYRELRTVAPDGLPLDPQVGFAEQAARFPAYAGTPCNVTDSFPQFEWPTAVLSGERDMRSVRPVARRIAEALPDGVLVPFDESAHSFLDFHPKVAIAAARAVANGTHRRLPGLAARLESLPRPPQSAVVAPMLTGWLAVERAWRGVRSPVAV